MGSKLGHNLLVKRSSGLLPNITSFVENEILVVTSSPFNSKKAFFYSLQFTGLSVTSGVDQMVALHTSSNDDILLCLQRGELCPNQDRVGELVGTLVDHFIRSVPQPHAAKQILSCGFSSNVVMATGSKGRPTFI